MKVSALIGSLGVFGIGLNKVSADPTFQPVGERVRNSTKTGQQPEARVDLKTGKVELNSDIMMRNSVCLGCFTNCGNRLKIDKKTGTIMKVFGNPYHPTSAENILKYDTPLLESYLAASRYNNLGNEHRATVCPRGNSAFETTYDPQRILTPLKRNGERGSGKWKPITYEELLRETVNGGKLFQDIGEDREIEGFKQVRDFKTLIDPTRPEYGPKSNQLVVMGGRDDGRTEFAQRFFKAFGTKNMFGHGGICGGARRVAYQSFTDVWDKRPHMKPDYDESDFIIFFGTAPGQAGNPYQPMIKKTNKAATEGRLQFVVVDPVLPNLTGNQAKWIPIHPGTDGALAMAMIRLIFEKKRYNGKYLSAVNKEAAQSIGYPSWTNAAFLIIDEPKHPNFRKFLRASELGIGGEDEYVIIDRDTLKPSTDKKSNWGEIFFKGEIQDKEGNTVKVKTSLATLKENADKYTIKQYSDRSGVPVDKIEWLAHEFTNRGTRVGTDHHGGPSMHTNGFHSSLAIILLNALVGSVNKKGGMSKSAGGYKAYDVGPRYDLLTIPGQPKVKGIKISREKVNYETTTEYKEKVARGENPYPAKEPWYPIGDSMIQDVIPNTIKGHPYKAKILLMHQANPLYTSPGLYSKEIVEGLKNPENLPLFVAIDVVMGETTAFADYIVPDTVFYESWGLPSVWNGMVNKVSSVRWPVIVPRTPKLPDGRHINSETYLIDVAKLLGMPGFGDQAIPGTDGKLYPLNRQEDFYLRGVANIAFDLTPVPDVDQVEVKLTEIDQMLKNSEKVLSYEEWQKALYVMVRGGRFEPHEDAYKGDDLKYQYPNMLHIYNETVGSTKHSITGEYFEGTAAFIEPAFADGKAIKDEYPESEWPFTLFSYKSRFRSVSTLANVSKLRDIQESNRIQIARADAERLGIKDGDQVKIVTTSGEVKGIAKIRDGLMPGSIAIAFGYGHWEYGSRTYQIDGKEIKGNEKIAAGIALNPIVFREKNGNIVTDHVSGVTSRNDTRAKIMKV